VIAAALADVGQAIAQATGSAFQGVDWRAASGGCINLSGVVIGRDGRRFFVKLNQAALLPMFEAEADGLDALHTASAIRAPMPVAFGIADDQAFLAMEWLDLGNEALSGAVLGEQLAELHSRIGPAHGWRRDNFIGSTPQRNREHADWIAFFSTQRLQPQFDLASRNGGSSRLLASGGKLCEQLEGLFAGYTPPPSLLHGDLWRGNVAMHAGAPVIFDPAVYYGDRESDLAMSELFGGFPAAFFAAYHAAWPLDPGYRSRKLLYQLYHVLNHFNLFGGGYGGQALAITEGLLADLR
jgi:protein-ribulosamine 3-kinase